MAYGTRSAKVRMDSLNTLTFYNGEVTAARRSSPVPQLECVGKPCKLYQPDVVQCTAVGRNGPDVEWKCQAELPSTIRFGRVEVSCEGYDYPDDPFILKGSCGLTYNLVRVDPSLENENYAGTRSSSRSYASQFTNKFLGNFFNFLSLAILFYILYVILVRPLLSYFTRNMPLASGATRPGGAPPRPWFGGLGGWGPGGGGGGGGGTGRPGGGRPSDAPPPYSRKDDTSTSTSHDTGTSMWSDIGRDLRRGATMGVGSTLAEVGINSLLGRNRRQEPYQQQRFATAPPFMQPAGFARGRSPFASRDDFDRGEGSSGTSGLGSMRTSSGFGGTRNR